MHLIKSLLTQQLQGMMILLHSRINLQPFSQIFHLKMHNSVFKQAEVEPWMKALKAEPCAPLIPHLWSYGGGSFPDPCCDDALQKHLFQLEFICSVLPFPKEPTCCKELFNSSGLIPKKPTLGTHLSKAAEKKGSWVLFFIPANGQNLLLLITKGFIIHGLLWESSKI